MLNSSKNVFVIILKLSSLEIELGISTYEKHIPKSRVSFYLKSGIFHGVQKTATHPAGYNDPGRT